MNMQQAAGFAPSSSPSWQLCSLQRQHTQHGRRRHPPPARTKWSSWLLASCSLHSCWEMADEYRCRASEYSSCPSSCPGFCAGDWKAALLQGRRLGSSPRQ